MNQKLMRRAVFLFSLLVSAHTAAAQLAPSSTPVEEFHDYLRSRTIGIPTYVDDGVHYDPSYDLTRADNPGQAVFSMPLDGGMRPRVISIEVRGDGIDPTAIMLDHSNGTKRTVSGTDTPSSVWHWIDIPLGGIVGSVANATLPRPNQAILNLRVEFGAKSGEVRRVVLFYNRPTLTPTGVPFPEYPGNIGIGDIFRLLTWF